MADSETLTRWLRAAAARLRLRRTLNQIGWFGTGLCALIVLYATARLLLPAVVVAALVPLLLLGALAVALACGWRATRRPSLQEAAAAADREARLHDEVRSAFWFAQAGDRPPEVTLLLQRAAGSVQGLDARNLFPLFVPPSLWAASCLAILAGALLAVPPDIARSQSARGEPGLAADTAELAQRQPGDTRRQQGEETTATTARTDEQGAQAAAAWRQIEALADSLPASAATGAGALRRSIASRDRQAVRQAALALRATLPETAARPEGEQLSAEVAQGILERLESLLAQDGGAGRPQPGAEQPTARLTQQLREDVSEAHRRRPGQQSQGETALNTLLRAMARNSLGPSEAVRGEGETTQEGGRSNMSGGAMGRRVGVSRAGASEEDAPAEGNPEGDAPADPVLGEPAKPLEMHLQKAQVGGDDPPDQDGIQEDFYAATQGQAAGVEYSAARALRSSAREATTRASRTPLAYDEAIKGYSLSQHRREAQARDPR